MAARDLGQGHDCVLPQYATVAPQQAQGIDQNSGLVWGKKSKMLQAGQARMDIFNNRSLQP